MGQQYEVRGIPAYNPVGHVEEYRIVNRNENLNYEIYINDVQSLYIGNGCNGLMVTVLYICFIIAYPGRWKPKLLFIIMGTLLLYVLNVIRIIMLTFDFLFDRDLFEFNHKYTYTFILYSVVFLCWMSWVNKYSITANIAKPQGVSRYVWYRCFLSEDKNKGQKKNMRIRQPSTILL